MSWTELRNVALVGTEKRQLSSVITSPLDGQPSEVAAMQHAALFGTQRRAGVPITRTTVEAEAEPLAAPTEQNPPEKASRLIELILSGNAVTASLQPPLIHHWLAECAAADCVVPHRSLVPLLDAGARSTELRSSLRPVLGHRGRWLAEMDDRWAWAVANTDSNNYISVDDFLRFSADAKGDYVRTLRLTNPAEARRLVEGAFGDMNAANRTQCVAALTQGLNDDDEEFLESCLTDGSKLVRGEVHSLLNGLPNSRRAQRMVNRLAPLVSSEGRLRKSVTVSWPDAPSKADKSDMTEADTDTEASIWLRDIVAGTPLSWWEQHLDASPDTLLGRNLTPELELITGLSIAAVCQGSIEWADALVSHGHLNTHVIDIASDDVLVAAIAKLPKPNEKTGRDSANLLLQRSGRWSLAYSEAMLKWMQKADSKTPKYLFFSEGLADRLDPESVNRLGDLTEKYDGYEREAARRVLQALTTHASITEAFER